ncbi:hypothetical protein HDE_04995 [Halotydeus destructor]|nr:hypothetical protein HDE_04995 [Halotydeus destructor]
MFLVSVLLIVGVVCANCANVQVTYRDRVYRYVGTETNKSNIVFPSDELTPGPNMADTERANEVTFRKGQRRNRFHEEKNSPHPTFSQDIPEQLLIKMKDLADPSRFMDTLVYETDPEVKGHDGISLSYLQRGYEGTGTGSGSTTEASSANKNGVTPFKKTPRMPKISSPAGCAVELRTVELESPKEHEMYYPWCVRLPRCSGCCPSSRLECVPTNVSYIDVTALRLRYAKFDQKFKFEGVKVFKMMKHESCQCQCIQQPEDCSQNQVYIPEECRCVCPDKKEADACSSLPFKIWNKENCSCSCRSRPLCSTGLFFDTETCRCKVSESTSKAADARWRVATTTTNGGMVKDDHRPYTSTSSAVRPEMTTVAGQKRR